MLGKFNIAIIGYGYWGPNLVRNFSGLDNCQVAYVCDQRVEQLALVAKHHPSIATTSDYQHVLADTSVNAVAIATPVSTHFTLAMQALAAGKHVWIEKPLTTTSQQASLLIEEAKRRKLILFVDHTFVYTPAVRRIKQLIDLNELGDIYYYDSTRVNLGLFQSDVSVLWDLAVHDLAIMDYLLGLQPSAVSATGIAHVPRAPENMAYLTLFFDRKSRPLIAHVHVNWLSPIKIRRTLIGGSQKMIVYDDLDATEKIKLYDKGIMVANDTESQYQRRVGYRTGDMIAPQLLMTEALHVAAAHFVGCCQTGETPITDGNAGLRVICILEAASESLSRNGYPINL